MKKKKKKKKKKNVILFLLSSPFWCLYKSGYCENNSSVGVLGTPIVSLRSKSYMLRVFEPKSPFLNHL